MKAMPLTMWHMFETHSHRQDPLRLSICDPINVKTVEKSEGLRYKDMPVFKRPNLDTTQAQFTLA